MRKHFNHIFTFVMAMTFTLMSVCQSLAAETKSYEMVFETEPVIDMITLDSDVIGTTEIDADLSWKTKQDKGKWIEDLGIGENVSSLVLVINNLDKKDPNALPMQVVKAEEKKSELSGNKNNAKIKKPVDITGKSKLLYFAKSDSGEWEEFFSVDGFLAGDQLNEKEVTYGVYTPSVAFGVKENPGSQLSYKQLTMLDYWCLDPSDANFGNIISVKSREDQPVSAIRMENLKTFCNYGMILKPEMEGTGYPALVFNCLQLDNNDGTFCGMQIPEQYMRMLVQSADENTRVIITDDLGNLYAMNNNEVE